MYSPLCCVLCCSVAHRPTLQWLWCSSGMCCMSRYSLCFSCYHHIISVNLSDYCYSCCHVSLAVSTAACWRFCVAALGSTRWSCAQTSPSLTTLLLVCVCGCVIVYTVWHLCLHHCVTLVSSMFASLVTDTVSHCKYIGMAYVASRDIVHRDLAGTG